MTGGEALAGQLKLEGVRHIFGVPGQQLDHALDALAKGSNQIAYVTTRHEQGSAYMADGYARASGGIGVCALVPGPGLLNAGAALATAYACSSPVLAIVGQIPLPLIGKGIGVLHEINGQSAVLDAFTKWHAMARSPAEVPRMVREAFVQLKSGRPRPVALEIPPDVLSAAADVALIDPLPAEDYRVRPDAAVVTAAAELLAKAAKPIIYAGWGVQAASAEDELKALAEALGAPVIMSRTGRGTLSDRHPLALTRLSGRKLLLEADVVLVIGSRFIGLGGKDMPTGAHAKLIMVDADTARLTRPRIPDVAVHGDAKLFLAAVGDTLGKRQTKRGNGSWPAAAERARAWAAAELASIAPQMAYLNALRSAIPDDGIVVTDLTQVAYPVRVAFPFYRPRTNFTSGYQGTLGFAFPMALGAKAADRDRAVVALAGDGGFGWCLPELATARQYDLAVVTVVFNDNAYGNVRRTQQDHFDGRFIGSALTNPDFVALAKSFGVDGVRVASPAELGQAVAGAIAKRAPAVIEVPIGDMPSPWHLLG
jgi:acetolactate synthase-1/2/3 large subunit